MQPHVPAETSRKSWACTALHSKTLGISMEGHSSHPSLWDPLRPAPRSCSRTVARGGCVLHTQTVPPEHKPGPQCHCQPYSGSTTAPPSSWVLAASGAHKSPHLSARSQSQPPEELLLVASLRCSSVLMRNT